MIEKIKILIGSRKDNNAGIIEAECIDRSPDKLL
jgi:hypothetical protein